MIAWTEVFSCAAAILSSCANSGVTYTPTCLRPWREAGAARRPGAAGRFNASAKSLTMYLPVGYGVLDVHREHSVHTGDLIGRLPAWFYFLRSATV